MLAVLSLSLSCAALNIRPPPLTRRTPPPRMTTSFAVEQAMAAAKAMKAAASANTPFTDAELDAAVLSLKCLIPDGQESVDWTALRELYANCAHLTHKDWAKTQESATALEKIIGTPDSPVFRTIFARVLDDGYWDAAEKTAAGRAADTKPWVVVRAHTEPRSCLPRFCCSLTPLRLCLRRSWLPA